MTNYLEQLKEIKDFDDKEIEILMSLEYGYCEKNWYIKYKPTIEEIKAINKIYTGFIYVKLYRNKTVCIESQLDNKTKYGKFKTANYEEFAENVIKEVKEKYTLIDEFPTNIQCENVIY